MANSTITITYERPGTTPPIFVAGSFTQPAWQPIELDAHKVNEEYVFSKTFDVPPGTHQYKFRVGCGDWWICDDTKPTVTDSAGNVNNVFTVQAFQTSDVGQPGTERADCNRGAEPYTETDSGHYTSPSLGLNGVDDSGAEPTRSSRREVALTGNGAADFHGANSDFEPYDNRPESTESGKVETHEASNGLGNSSTVTSHRNAAIHVVAAPENHRNDSSSASNTSAEPSQQPVPDGTKVRNVEEDTMSQKPVVVQKMFGSMSALLCGKRRKIFAVVFTALVIPILAWTWRS